MDGKAKMLPLKLVRSLVLGETINNPHILSQNQHYDHNDAPSEEANDADAPSHNSTRRRRRRRRNGSRSKTGSAMFTKSKTPALLFLPTKEIVRNTYRLATIARDLGMDLYPTPSLSHIIFSYPSSTPSPSSPSTPSSFPSTWSFSSSSASWPLMNEAVPIPFPSLTTDSVTHLRHFVSLSKGVFKLVFFNSDHDTNEACDGNDSNWDCCSISLYSRLTGDRIDSMESFCRALAGKGWTFFRTKKNISADTGDGRISGGNTVYLFRKVDVNRVRVGRTTGVGASSDGTYRVRELRLPGLDFRNAPLRILQYILLITDDIFCLS
ncbi:hypothetical protein L6164_010823 [Bauhinia variegata]|uniref:Uncharacterized protein n=1 Tax=Bauhinia variegata TaxID=167791 RepID=A0ACB9P3L9_BAUVA|nr:hypothetical protein L6164_010823 [Bauhinia variegata]